MNGTCRRFLDHWMPSVISVSGALIVAYFGYFEELSAWRGGVDEKLNAVTESRQEAVTSRAKLQDQVDKLIASVNQLNVSLAVNSDRIRDLSAHIDQQGPPF